MTPYESYWQARKQGYGTPELEATIAGNAYSSYCYANEIIKGRWEPGEAIIATDFEYSYCYARYVIKGRFPLGEPVIAQPGYWKYYLNDISMTEEDKTFLILRYGPPK